MKEGLTERNGWEIMSTVGVSIAPVMAQRKEKKRVGTGPPQNENHLAGISGMDSCQFARP